MTRPKLTGVLETALYVDDVARSGRFYQTVFGMAQLSEDKAYRIQRFGQQRTLVSIRQEEPPGMVDHFAIAVENFSRDAVTKELARHGLTPQENVQFGFHIKDPDGVNVQIV